MSNMSYCRFQNTDSDLADCESALEEIFTGEHGKLSREELAAAKRLLERCYDILKFASEHSEYVQLDDFDLIKVTDALIRADAANEE